MIESLKDRGYEIELLGPNHTGMAKRGKTKMLLVTEEFQDKPLIGLYAIDADCDNDATFLSITGPDALNVLNVLNLVLTALETTLDK